MSPMTMTLPERMQRLLVVALGALCVAGCGIAASVAEQAPSSTPTDGRMVRTLFNCSDDETIEMRLFPDASGATLLRQGRTTALQRRPAASGFHYSSDDTDVRGKGRALTLTIGRQPPIDCRQRDSIR